MGLISVLEQNKNNRNTRNKVSHRELKKKSELKFVIINKKPSKATRKVTLSSRKSAIKSQIGIIPLKKQEARVKNNE